MFEVVGSIKISLIRISMKKIIGVLPEHVFMDRGLIKTKNKIVEIIKTSSIRVGQAGIQGFS
jgi:hypothetical protein